VLGKFEELLLVLIIILVLFGAKKLPELSKAIAQSVREVKKGFRDEPETTEQAPADKEAEKTRPKA
jgi:sec-independent protein translocase protein TatA